MSLSLGIGAARLLTFFDGVFLSLPFELVLKGEIDATLPEPVETERCAVLVFLEFLPSR